MAFATLVHLGIGFGVSVRLPIMARMIAAHPMAVFANCHPAVARLLRLRTMHQNEVGQSRRASQDTAARCPDDRLHPAAPLQQDDAHKLKSNRINPIPELIANAPAVHDEEVGACAPQLYAKFAGVAL